MILDKNERLWGVKNNGIKGFSGLIACLDMKKRQEILINVESKIQENFYSSKNSRNSRTQLFSSEATTLVKMANYGSFGGYKNSVRNSTESKKLSVVSSNTKTSFNKKIKHDISVFEKDSKKNQIVLMLGSFLVKVCMEDLKIMSVQELGLKKRVDKIFKNFYKYLADSAFCPSTGMLILAFRTPGPNLGHSTKSFADFTNSSDSTARICFFNINRSSIDNNPLFLKEIIIGGKNRSKIEYLNSFSTMSVDPSNQFLLVSGNQSLGNEQSTVQILSLRSENFLEVLASQNFDDCVFTENGYWLTEGNFVLANGLGSLVIAKIERSKVFGLKILKRELKDELVCNDGEFS